MPGIGPSPDKMLQGRLFAYGDAHRYRLGINHTQLPVNAPQASRRHANYGRDGAMRFDDNGGRAQELRAQQLRRRREQTSEPLYARLESHGLDSGTHADARHAEDDDFVQAGELYRLMDADARERLVANIAGSLAQVARDDIVERAIAHFRAADPDYGARVEAAVKSLRA